MSGTLTPMAGMGSNGAALGSPSMLTPAMIQMLMARSGMPSVSTPLAQGQMPTPMSMAMPHPMGGAMGPMAQMPNAAAMQAAAQHAQGTGSILGALGSNPQLMQQLLQIFRGGQSGINPLAAGVPSGMMPAMPAANGMQPGPV